MLQQSNYTVITIKIPDLPSLDEGDGDELDELEITDDFASKQYFNLTYLSHDFHSQYHPASNITLFLRSLERTFPDYVKVQHVGHSYLGRRILAVKISSPEPVTPGKKPRKGIVLLGAQHAREVSNLPSSLLLRNIGNVLRIRN